MMASFASTPLIWAANKIIDTAAAFIPMFTSPVRRVRFIWGIHFAPRSLFVVTEDPTNSCYKDAPWPPRRFLKVRRSLACLPKYGRNSDETGRPLSFDNKRWLWWKEIIANQVRSILFMVASRWLSLLLMIQVIYTINNIDNCCGVGDTTIVIITTTANTNNNNNNSINTNHHRYCYDRYNNKV